MGGGLVSRQMMHAPASAAISLSLSFVGAGPTNVQVWVEGAPLNGRRNSGLAARCLSTGGLWALLSHLPTTCSSGCPLAGPPRREAGAPNSSLHRPGPDSTWGHLRAALRRSPPYPTRLVLAACGASCPACPRYRKVGVCRGSAKYPGVRYVRAEQQVLKHDRMCLDKLMPKVRTGVPRGGPLALAMRWR
jgi:hypothetical protein